ncbi:D-alanyl-D-alanine carboxypeptidase [Streptomyces xiaopingdaonensis]|uniref:D-alanyl-D-alanine carboxypeptidase n=1 Tax=Streptomyces xiaopingdaonensis TaxID=1565415 RepID=UPI0002EBE385|nr:D-alanyl-D-alanine carboxypeptidase [Streptomyces xiaopingdaonensis]
MAGESPGRSEREKSSGETTRDDGSVARPEETAEKQSPTAGPEKAASDDAPERDESGAEAAPDADEARAPAGGKGVEPPDEERPEESAEGGGDAEGGPGEGDERLKAVVAAWVAGDRDEGGISPSEGAEGEAVDDEAGGSSAARTESNGDGPRPSDTEAESGLPVRPKSAPEPEPDQPTAMFSAVRREEPSPDDEDAAARRAERMTTAFFGSAKEARRASVSEEAAGESDGAAGEGEDAGERKAASDSAGGEAGSGPSPRAGASGAGSGYSGAGSVGDASGDGDGAGSDEGAGPGGTEPEEGDGAGAKEGAGRPVDQPTTAIRSFAPGKASSGGGRGKDPRTGSPAEKGAGSGGAKDSGTAAGSSGAEGASAKEARDAKDESGKRDEPNKSQEKQESSPGGEKKPDGAESEAERTSQFVPLKSLDDSAREAKAVPPPPSVPPKPAGPPPSSPPEGTKVPGEEPGARPPEPGALPAEGEAERTRQQPAPEPQPLDLLAQLTNTPPPPETPLRTAVRRVKIWTPLVLLLAVVFVVVQAVRPLPDASLELTAAKTYTFEGDEPAMPWPSEGQAVVDVSGLGSFGTHGEQKPVPIASVAKVMTAYVILRDHPVKKGKGAVIPVDRKAEEDAGLSAQNESTVEVEEGDKITQREALDAIMIASANNVARLLARWDAGSEKAFVKKMNEAAKDLGMENTTYTDPSGLKVETVSTAEDQVKLGKKVMENPLFREVVRQPQYTDAKGEVQPNWNKLVPLDGVVGIKTGTTTRAGGNLLFAAEKEVGGTTQLVVGAVLGQYKPSILDTVLAESKKLIDTAQDSLESVKVLEKGETVGYVDDRLGGKTPVVVAKDVEAVGWAGLKVRLDLDAAKDGVPHEASAGDRVGELTAGEGPGQVKVPVVLKEDLTEPGFGSKLTHLF